MNVVEQTTAAFLARGRDRWIAAAAVFAAVFAYRFLSYTGFPNDHFVYLARAQQMLLGAWPVRDFVDPGFPLMYLTSASGLTLFGHNLLGEAVIVFGGFAAAAAMSFGLVRAVAGSTVVAAFAVTLQALAYPRSYSYPKLPLHALAIALCWAYLARPTRARRAGLAALVAVAALFRPDHGIVIALASLVAILWADSRPAPARAKTALGFAATAAAFVLPWFIFLQNTTGLAAYARSVIGFTSTKADVGRMGWPSFRLDALVTGQNAEAFLYYLFVLLPFVGAVVLLRRGTAAAPMPDAAGRLWTVIILAACVNATLLRNPLSNRLGDVAVPQTILAAWLLPAAWRTLRASRPPGRLALRTGVAAVVALLTLSVVEFGDTADRLDSIGPLRPGALARRAATVTRALRDIDTFFGIPTETPLAPLPLVTYLRACTQPDDRVMYVGYAPETYFFARRGFAAGQVVFEGTYYTSPEEQALMLSRLRREQAPVIAMPDENAADFRDKLDAVAAYIDANYARAGTIDLPGDRRGDVFLDRRRASAGVYAPLGWPCFARTD